jgi:magnesium-protoporphyrin O-methyltransferase
LASATDVDASGAYIEVARREATKRGFGDRVTYRRGDFVEESAEVGPADLVTLDRVICCYPDLDGLASKAAERARVKIGLVHPHDRWWMRWGVKVVNLVGRPFGCPRFFVHRTARLEAILRRAGLEREWAGGTLFWRVAVYKRVAAASG